MLGICYSIVLVDRNNNPCLNDITVSLENINGRLEENCLITAQMGDDNDYLFLMEPNELFGRVLILV